MGTDVAAWLAAQGLRAVPPNAAGWYIWVPWPIPPVYVNYINPPRFGS